MFSFYTLLEKPVFLSLMGDSGGEMRRKKWVEFILKIEIEKFTKNSEYTETWASFNKDHECPRNGIICFNRNYIHHFK